MSWKQWSIAEEVKFDDFQNLIQDQVIQVYENSTARGSALGTAVTAGMFAHLLDTSSTEYYNGTVWLSLSNPGDITDVTAGTALTGGGTSGAVTLNVNLAAVGSSVLASPQITGTATLAAGTVTGNLVVSGTATLSADTSIGPVTSAQLGFVSGVTSNIQTQLNATQPFTQPVLGRTAAYTAVAGDANDLLYFTNSTAVTLTIPDLIAIGDRIDIIRDGAGTVTIAAGTGVTSWAGAGTAGTAVTFKMDQQHNGATVYKVAANTYRVIGKVIP